MKGFILGIVCYFVLIMIIKIIDPSRYNQKIGDWARRFDFHEFAIERYSTAININPFNPGAFNSRGVSRYNQGQFEEALIDYNRAIELDPQNALAIKNRAYAFLYLGNAEEAKNNLLLACKLGLCEDSDKICTILKRNCEMGGCIGYETAVKIGICQK